MIDFNRVIHELRSQLSLEQLRATTEGNALRMNLQQMKTEIGILQMNLERLEMENRQLKEENADLKAKLEIASEERDIALLELNRLYEYTGNEGWKGK